MTRLIRKRTAELFSTSMVCVIPLMLVVYRLIYASEPTLAAAICRPTILVVCLGLFVICYESHIAAIERKMVHVLGVLCSTLLFTSLLAADTERAMQEWIKLVAMCAIAIMLCRPLMRPSIARIFGIAMVASSIVLAGMIVSTYVRYMGLVMPTYSAIRVVKGAALDNDNIALNPLGFECVFAFLCGMCLLRGSRLLWCIGAVLLVISSLLTGSRAPIAVFIVSATTLLILNGLRSRFPALRATSFMLGLAMVAGALIAIVAAGSQQLSAMTEGRWNLWSVAMHKFSMHPLWGNGYLSVLDDPTFLAGGYHSEYLTALAEQGVIGFAAVVYLFGFVLKRCWQLALDPLARHRNGQVILFACLFLMFRALVELPGLFGTAQGPADFLAYIFLAIAMSRTPDSKPQAVSAQAHWKRTRLSHFAIGRTGRVAPGEHVY